jgi:hypothetical protein
MISQLDADIPDPFRHAAILVDLWLGRRESAYFEMKMSGTAKTEPPGSEPSEFERFTGALRKILSVKKTDLDLHKPIRPRNAKRKKSTS